jgi:hypothetical protein
MAGKLRLEVVGGFDLDDSIPAIAELSTDTAIVFGLRRRVMR